MCSLLFSSGLHWHLVACWTLVWLVQSVAVAMQGLRLQETQDTRLVKVKLYKSVRAMEVKMVSREDCWSFQVQMDSAPKRDRSILNIGVHQAQTSAGGCGDCM